MYEGIYLFPLHCNAAPWTPVAALILLLVQGIEEDGCREPATYFHSEAVISDIATPARK